MACKNKLSDSQAIEAYSLATSGGNINDIASMFGVSKATITNIALGKAYTHLNLTPFQRRTFLGGSLNASIEEKMASGFIVDEESGCHNWIRAKTNRGYGAITINSVTHCAHRIAYELAYGKIDENLCVLHNCDNPSCVNPSHLRLGSHDENMYDKVIRKRVPAAEDHYNATMTRVKVIDILRLSGEGVSPKKIAETVGVKRHAVYSVLGGRSWNTVTGLPRKPYKSRSKYLKDKQ